jgi:hypothetical protein
MTYPFDQNQYPLNAKPKRGTATLADWENWVGRLTRFELGQLYPGMLKNVIATYEMVQAEEEQKIAQYGPFVQNNGPNFDKSFNDPAAHPGLVSSGFGSKPATPSPLSAIKPFEFGGATAKLAASFTSAPAPAPSPALAPAYTPYTPPVTPPVLQSTLPPPVLPPMTPRAPTQAFQFDTSAPVPLQVHKVAPPASPPGWRPMGLLDMNYVREPKESAENDDKIDKEKSATAGGYSSHMQAPTGGDDGSYVRQHGTSFATPEQAASDVVRRINPRSISENREYGGTIERVTFQEKGARGETVRKARYIATTPVPGSGDEVSHSSYSPENSVGIYHTHGDYSLVGSDGEPERVSTDFDQRYRRKMDEYASDVMSKEQKDYAQDLAAETRSARAEFKETFRSYLGTPSGRMVTHTPSQ